MNDIEIVEYADIDLSDSMLITAFPTVGLISSIAGHFIIDALKLDLAGGIISSQFMPATIIHKTKPSPPIRIFSGVKTCGPDESCKNLGLIISEFMPPFDLVKPLVDKILSWAEKKGCKMIVTLEGTHTTNPKQQTIFGVASTPEMKKTLQKYKIEEIKEGMITGDTGVLLYQGMHINKNVLCLLVEAHASYPDSRAAGMLLEKLDEMLPGIKLDVEPLYKQADEIEKKIRNFIEQSKPTAPAKPSFPGMYG